MVTCSTATGRLSSRMRQRGDVSPRHPQAWTTWGSDVTAERGTWRRWSVGLSGLEFRTRARARRVVPISELLFGTLTKTRVVLSLLLDLPRLPARLWRHGQAVAGRGP